MSTASDRVTLWRKNCKQKIVDAFGGECGICGYKKCNDSLSFHHLDPSKKEFSLGSIMAHPKKFELIIEEMRKCICVCNNCHGEIHSGVLQIPQDIKRFDEKLIKEKLLKSSKTHKCPICNEDTPDWNITCSRECAAKRAGRIEWEKYDLHNMIKTMSIVKIAEIIGCSDVAVHKQLKKQA